MNVYSNTGAVNPTINMAAYAVGDAVHLLRYWVHFCRLEMVRSYGVLGCRAAGRLGSANKHFMLVWGFGSPWGRRPLGPQSDHDSSGNSRWVGIEARGYAYEYFVIFVLLVVVVRK